MLPTWPTKCLAIDTGVTGPVAIPGSKLVRLVVTSTDSLARSCGWNTSGSPRSLGLPRMCALPRGAFVGFPDQGAPTHQKVAGLSVKRRGPRGAGVLPKFPALTHAGGEPDLAGVLTAVGHLVPLTTDCIANKASDGWQAASVAGHCRPYLAFAILTIEQSNSDVVVELGSTVVLNGRDAMLDAGCTKCELLLRIEVVASGDEIEGITYANGLKIKTVVAHPECEAGNFVVALIKTKPRCALRSSELGEH